MSRLSQLTRRPAELLRRPATKPPLASKAAAKPDAPKEPVKPEESAELLAQRDRLLEKFTVMQADLGGAFYEMAIRDNVRLDVLTRKAAELQRVDAELLSVERLLELERADAAGLCPGCGSPFGHGCGSAPSAGTRWCQRRRSSESVRARPVPARGRGRRELDRQTLQPAGRLVPGRDHGDRRRGDDERQRQRPAGRDAGSQPRGKHGAGRAHPGAQPRTGRRQPSRQLGTRPSSAASEPLPAAAAPVPEEAAAEEPKPTPTDPEEPASEPGPIQHVFVISLASSGYEADFGRTLRCYIW